MPIQTSRLKNVGVLFEDEDLLAVHKPYGMPVHGGAGPKRTTLLALLERAYEDPTPLTLVHRLDADTTGVLVIAKHPESARAIRTLWARANKVYDAVVHGRVEGRQTIDAPLATPEGRPQNAVTHIEGRRILDVRPVCSWVSITLDTGRKHQIRRHLAGRGIPIVGDDRYGAFALNRNLRQSLREVGVHGGRRLLLHASEIRLPHPRTGIVLSISAPFPTRFMEILRAGGIKEIASSSNLPLT